MPQIQAHAYTKGRGGQKILWAVIHDMETGEGSDVAETVARWFAREDAKTSAHECIDNNSFVTCVDEVDTAWAAPKANQKGYHFEIAGRARQTRAEWLDAYSKAALEIAAKRVARLCIKQGIPVRRLTATQIRNGEKGIVGHLDITNALNGGEGHTDPGPNFPWDYFLGRVSAYVKAATQTAAHPPAPTPSWYKRPLRRGDSGSDVKAMQVRLKLTADGKFGPKTEAAVKYVQSRHGLKTTGVVDVNTAKAIG